MCLAIPAKVLSIQPEQMAIVDIAGIKKEISIALIEDIKKNDYVIIHMGYAIKKLNQKEADNSLEILSQMV